MAHERDAAGHATQQLDVAAVCDREVTAPARDDVADQRRRREPVADDRVPVSCATARGVREAAAERERLQNAARAAQAIGQAAHAQALGGIGGRVERDDLDGADVRREPLAKAAHEVAGGIVVLLRIRGGDDADHGASVGGANAGRAAGR